MSVGCLLFERLTKEKKLSKLFTYRILLLLQVLCFKMQRNPKLNRPAMYSHMVAKL